MLISFFFFLAITNNIQWKSVHCLSDFYLQKQNTSSGTDLAVWKIYGPGLFPTAVLYQRKGQDCPGANLWTEPKFAQELKGMVLAFCFKTVLTFRSDWPISVWLRSLTGFAALSFCVSVLNYKMKMGIPVSRMNCECKVHWCV